MPDPVLNKNQIERVNQQLKNLPVNEFAYYVTVFLVALQNEPQQKEHSELLSKIEQLVSAIDDFYRDPQTVNQVSRAVDDLVSTTGRNTLMHYIKSTVLKICGAVIAILAGVFFGLTSFAIGLLSDINIIGNIQNSGLGFFAGLAFGLFIGYRCPATLFQKSLTSKLGFCIDNLVRLRDELKDKITSKKYQNHETYQEETKKYILDTFFKTATDKDVKFEEFLKSTQEFQVCTTTAGHISERLKGHLGHHALIRFKINGITDVPIEFGDRKCTPTDVDQYETPREVPGQVLFDMLVLERILRDTHKVSWSTLRDIYEIGSDDCRTYVDKILIGTKQDPTIIGRFSTQDSLIGRCIAPVVGFFSKTGQKDLHCLIDDPNKYQIHYRSVHP